MSTPQKTILVTGATSGFGKAIAERFAQQGYRVIIAGRRKERLHELSQELKQDHNEILALQMDVRDKTQVAKAFQQLAERGITLDILVNNAGLAAGMSAIDEGDEEDWEVMIDTNIKGVLYVTKQAVPLMKNSSAPHIINIGSTAGKLVYKNGNVYCATKFAVDALTQSMRIDLLEKGIKATAINPGMAETEFSLVRFKGDAERAKKVYEGFQPLMAADIADIAWYVANLPSHVCINDLTVTCTTQANGFYNLKKN